MASGGLCPGLERLHCRAVGPPGLQRERGCLGRQTGLAVPLRGSDSAARVPNRFAICASALKSVLFFCCAPAPGPESLRFGSSLRARSGHVLAADAGDRALDNRGTCCPLADFGRNIGRELRVGGSAHQAEGLAHARVGKQRQKPAAHSPTGRPASGAGRIEVRVASRIREIREHDRALARESVDVREQSEGQRREPRRPPQSGAFARSHGRRVADSSCSSSAADCHRRCRVFFETPADDSFQSSATGYVSAIGPAATRAPVNIS